MEKNVVANKLPGIDENLEKYIPLLSPQEKILYNAYEKRRQEKAYLMDQVRYECLQLINIFKLYIVKL